MTQPFNYTCRVPVLLYFSSNPQSPFLIHSSTCKKLLLLHLAPFLNMQVYLKSRTVLLCLYVLNLSAISCQRSSVILHFPLNTMFERFLHIALSLICYPCEYHSISPICSLRDRSEKAMAPHSSTRAWKIPWTEEPGRLQSMGSQRVRHLLSDFTFTFMHWRRKWQPTPVFLPGETQGRQSLVSCHLWGRTESDTNEATQQQQQRQIPMFSTMPCSTNHLQVIKLIYASLETKSSTGVEWMGPGIYTHEIKLSISRLFSRVVVRIYSLCFNHCSVKFLLF